MAQAKKPRGQIEAEQKNKVTAIKNKLTQLKNQPTVTTAELLELVEQIAGRVIPLDEP